MVAFVFLLLDAEQSIVRLYIGNTPHFILPHGDTATTDAIANWLLRIDITGRMTVQAILPYLGRNERLFWGAS